VADESRTPDVIALTRAMGAAESVDETMSFFGPDPVCDWSPLGLEVFEGSDAVRGSLEAWLETFEAYEEQEEEVLDLGRGVVLVASRMSGRLRGSQAQHRVQRAYGFVREWTDGKLSRLTVYPDAEEARAAAERLVQAKG
jgi:hypothetical protein